MDKHEYYPSVTRSNQLHVHIDPVGGMAGDMFVAAMLDTFPELMGPCLQDLDTSGVLKHVNIELQAGKSHGLAVQRFCISRISDKPRATGLYAELTRWLQNSALGEAVGLRAQALLKLLAEAESRVHGVSLDDVHFHEVADWDSVADMVAAASLIEHCAVDNWSCACLPVGSGLVKTEHGMLPLPAPATVVLLEGLATWDDGESGERVTPTGAAIIKYLSTLNNSSHSFSRRPLAVGIASGMGAGQRSLKDRPNVVRCSVYELAPVQATVWPSSDHWVLESTPGFEHELDKVAQLNFAIDDMNSEELAVALQYVRQSDGVFDVSHSTSYGKKGRMMFDVTVLCSPDKEPDISRLCFSETSTLGMRVQLIARRVLKRRLMNTEGGKSTAGVKLVQRPLPAGEQESTLKVESDDLRRIAGLYARREQAARIAQATQASQDIHESPDDKP